MTWLFSAMRELSRWLRWKQLAWLAGWATTATGSVTVSAPAAAARPAARRRDWSFMGTLLSERTDGTRRPTMPGTPQVPLAQKRGGGRLGVLAQFWPQGNESGLTG